MTWSSQFCLLQRRTNINKIENRRVGLYERLVTFEGPEHFSVLDSVTSPTLAGDLQKICRGIVEHIRAISNDRVNVTRMVLHFKLDPLERIWLMYTTGLTVVDKSVFPVTIP